MGCILANKRTAIAVQWMKALNAKKTYYGD
jgi:hypothetical protein